MRAYSRTDALIQEVTTDFFFEIESCHSFAVDFFSKIWQLVDLLSDPDHGCSIVAEGFATILAETEECLNLNSHANIR